VRSVNLSCGIRVCANPAIWTITRREALRIRRV